jgi:predicted phage terminase large subunit-like protein
MPRKGAINPKTGKRLDWEAEQRQLRGDDLREINKQIGLLKRQQKAIEARSNLLTFTQFTMPDQEDPNDIDKSRYEAARFHRLVAAELDKFLRGQMVFDDGRECTQLIFCMPPRHGKTELATKRLAAQFSGNNPGRDVIVAAAGDDLAQDFGADVRAIMHSPQFKQVFPGFRLRRGGNAKDNIQTEQGGRLVFAGRGGQINGRGAHLLLIDDLYKDANEARSQAIRDQAWEWLVKVALYRRMGKRLTIITMTRWHSDDIIGRLTDPDNPHYSAEEAANWKIIRLPGLAEEDDPLGRKPGEALWPEVRRDGSCYDEAYHLANQRRDPLGFAALTQQRPTVADGVLFRRENITFYEPKDLPEDLRIYCASDHAVATGQRNDYTVLIKIGVDSQNNIYVLDCFRDKVKSDKAVEAMLAMASGKHKPLLWWAEKGHISKSIGPFLRKRMLETGIFINIREVTPAVDKEQRAQSIAARVAMGKVYFPKFAVWTQKVIDEMLAFPNGTHDDAVDALAYIGLGLQSQFAAANSSAKKKIEKPEFGTLAWVKLADKWANEQKALKAAGGF